MAPLWVRWVMMVVLVSWLVSLARRMPPMIVRMVRQLEARFEDETHSVAG